MEITEISVDHYERVIHGIDPDAGLNAFIAVHSTALGPALGGMRMLPYASDEEALEDATRLAKAMSYKAADIKNVADPLHQARGVIDYGNVVIFSRKPLGDAETDLSSPANEDLHYTLP